MGPRPAPPEHGAGLTRRRVISALALAPPALLAVYLGPPFTDLLVALAGACMTWEWARMCGKGRPGAAGWAEVAVALAAIILAAAGLFAWALGALVLGALAIAASGTLHKHRVRPLLAAGLLYIGLACLSFQWVSHRADAGALLIFWLFAVIWASDSGAYFTGRALGGPKLAPRVSPGKTWSGVAGGLAAGTAAGAILAEASGLGTWPGFLAPSLFLALVGQLGDLLESFIKRRFGVKDSSGLIPGHGGVLDRVDSVLAGCLFVAPFGFITEAAI